MHRVDFLGKLEDSKLKNPGIAGAVYDRPRVMEGLNKHIREFEAYLSFAGLTGRSLK